VTVDGAVIRLTDSSASSGIFLGHGSGKGASDPEVADAFRTMLRPGMVVFDCGAHVGEYTLMFSRLVGPDGAVYAFEPDPRVFEMLEWNVRSNAMTNVTTAQAALSSASGRAEYAVHPDATCSSLAEFGDARGDVEIVDVPTTSLDDYAHEQGLVRVDALKIDVEGAEGAVLAGAAGLLADKRPALVFVECHSAAAEEEVRGTLEAAGYAIDPNPAARLHTHILARPAA
jgi:FkbM family methyltransferase